MTKVYFAGNTGKEHAFKDRNGVPIAVNRCPGYGSNHQLCIRPAGHNGRHVTSAEFRR